MPPLVWTSGPPTPHPPLTASPLTTGRPLIGADDPICLRLAQMATAAVDTAKNGRFVPLPRALEAPLYPHWMERRADRSYKSTSVLGEMYDRATDLLQNLFAPGRCEQALCDGRCGEV